MKETSLSKNFIYNLLYQILLYAVPFITTPYLSRVLYAEGIGRYSFAQSIVSYFVLAATLGTNLYGQRQIASIKNDPSRRNCIFWEIVLLRIGTVFVALLVYFLCVFPLCPDKHLYSIAAIEILSVALDISWFFQGSENFCVITNVSGACKVISIALIFLFVKDNSDLNRYVLIYCGTTAIGNLLQWACLPRALPRSHKTKRTLHPLEHLYPSFLLFTAQVAIQVYTVLDKTMIGMITGSDAQNGYYEQAQKMIRVLTSLTTSIGAVMTSRIASLWKEKKTTEIQSMVETSFRVIFALGMPVAMGMWVIAPRFVPVFYGEGFEPVIPLLRLLSVLVLVVGCSNVTGIQYLVPTGKERYLTRSVAIGAVINFFLNLLWIGKYQAMGAATASLIAEVCVTAIQLFTVRKELYLKPILHLFFRYFAITMAMSVLTFTIELFAPAGILGLSIIIVSSVVLYGLGLILLRDPIILFFVEKQDKGISQFLQ